MERWIGYPSPLRCLSNVGRCKKGGSGSEEPVSCRCGDEVGQRYLRALFFRQYAFEKWHEDVAALTPEGGFVLYLYDPSP